MSDPTYMCPDCGFNELTISGKGLKAADGSSLAKSSCPNCSWEGPLSATVGVLTTERLWTSNAIGDLMLRLVTKHAAGPMVQAYEFIGLLPKSRDVRAESPEGADPSADDVAEAEEHNELVQACRNHVMRAIFSAAIEAGFAAAEEAHRFYATKTNTPLHPVLKHDPPENGREFGGDVVNLSDRRK